MRSRSSLLRRGSTLIELLLVVALQVIVVGAVSTLYIFMIQQCGQASAAVGSINQANGAMDAIAATVRQSMVCATVTSGGQTGLRCTLPSNAVDTDGDGAADVWYPTKFAASGKPVYTAGARVWYYQADATGAFGTTGTTLWRATRADDANPTASNADTAWALYYGGKTRFPLVDTLTFGLTGSAGVTVAVVASASARAPNGSGVNASSTDKQATSLRRTILWRADYE